MDSPEYVASYIDRIGDPDAVDAIAAVDGVDAAVRATAQIVREAIGGTGKREDLAAALTWIRDASIGVGSASVKADVRACVPKILTPVLADALVAPVRIVREQAIYTLGKMSFAEDLSLLLDVFDRYLDRDPLLVPRLIGEVSWLGGEGAPLYARVRGHSHYLTRWSFFAQASASPHVAKEQIAELQAHCAELENDPSALIQAEARQLLAEIAEIAMPGDRHSRERKRARAELEARAPLRFNAMALRFDHAHIETDYDVATLDAFVRGLSAET